VSVKARKPIDEYLELPEGYPAELIGGEVVMSPSPNVRHQEIVKSIVRSLLNFDPSRGRVFYEIDVHFDDENVLRPDVIFIKKENEGIIGENWIEGPPDIVFEVLSKATESRDLTVKKDLYEKFGVKEYWVVDPEEERVYVYSLKGGRYEMECSGKKCSSKVLKGFEWGFKK